MTFGGKRTPELAVEKKQVRRDSTTETSRPEKNAGKGTQSEKTDSGKVNTKVRKGHSFSVGGK
jgi:hypothetical protein